MGIGMTLLHHKGFTGLSRLLHDTSGKSSMKKSACYTHGNEQHTMHTEARDIQQTED